MTKDDKKDSFKIVLAGDSGTGKTSLLSRFTRNEFDSKYNPTCGVGFDTYDMIMDNKTIKIEIWDLGGQEKYRNMATSLFLDADGILLVYDITKFVTFENISGWLKDITKLAPPKTMIQLVGNKSDLHDQRAVPIKIDKPFPTNHHLSFTETSALDASHLTETFHSMVQELSCKDAQQQQEEEEPFKIVLIDIEKAALDGTIYCVEKPLTGDDDLKFIAISYRWGEVQEQCIDTKCGYMASVTSFHLDDFYNLCFNLRRDPDLISIDYVWVDAICVNQSNQTSKKATIYKMSDIYKRANYIVAVPDLHKHYLLGASTWQRELLMDMERLGDDIYGLLHGHCFKDYRSHKYEDWFYDYWFATMDIPDDQILRKSLAQHSNRFLEYIKKYNVHDANYNTNHILDHIRDAIKDFHQQQLDEPTNSNIWSNHQHDWLHRLLKEVKNDQWKQLISESAKRLMDIMEFLTFLVKDWSSRVWVASEYHIAEKKDSHKMKFWFISLGNLVAYNDNDDEEDDDDQYDDLYFRFFEFDFGGPLLMNMPQEEGIQDTTFMNQVYTAYTSFHTTMARQLTQRSFLEMILKSKASRNEDRFYAIFPGSRYRDKIQSNDMVNGWNIGNIISVKLKLYELMNTKDKLALLFLSAHSKNGCMTFSFPMFASLDITWPEDDNCLSFDDTTHSPSFNFDLDNDTTIQLIYTDNDDDNTLPHYKLSIWVKKFCFRYILHDSPIREHDSKYRDMFESLKINVDKDDLSLVCIPLYAYNNNNDLLDFCWPSLTNAGWDIICLAGSFEKNKWLPITEQMNRKMLSNHNIDLDWQVSSDDADQTHFNIY